MVSGAAALTFIALQAGGAAPPAACPSVDAVWEQVAGLVGRERVAAPATRPTLTVVDLGERYRVTVAGRVHDYDDAARDCARRAQVAAVFVGLTLWPLEMVAPPAPPPPPAVVAGPAIALALAPWVGVAAASGQGGPSRAAGVALRASVSGTRFGVVAGLGADWPIRLVLRGLSVEERRFPLDVGGRVAVGGERAAFALDVGVVATLVAIGPPGGASTHALDLGGRAGATVEVRLSRRSALAPALVMGAFTEISPAARRLAFEPDGPVGRASWLRAGGLLGFSLRLR